VCVSERTVRGAVPVSDEEEDESPQTLWSRILPLGARFISFVVVSSLLLLLRTLAFALAEDSLPVGGVLFAVTPPRFGRLVRQVRGGAASLSTHAIQSSAECEAEAVRVFGIHDPQRVRCRIIARPLDPPLGGNLDPRTGPHELPHAWPASPCAARANSGMRIGWKRSRANGRCAIERLRVCFVSQRVHQCRTHKTRGRSVGECRESPPWSAAR
jgi:hypothetical protein